MKKLVSLLTILTLLINNVSLHTIAMSPERQALYQAAIVELDVSKALNLLQQNNIDLNEHIYVHGKQTTFLHELFRITKEFFSCSPHIDIKFDDNLYNENFFLAGTSMDPISSLNYRQSYNDYEKELLSDLQLSLRHLCFLFLGFGANVDLKDSSETSVRELAMQSQENQGTHPFSDIITNCPLANNKNYENYKERARKTVIEAIKCKKRSVIFLCLLLLFSSTIFLFYKGV